MTTNGSSVDATVALRQAMPRGSVFLQDGLEDGSASELTGPLVDVRPARTPAGAAPTNGVGAGAAAEAAR